jgi:hypothetical protein
MPQGRRPTHPGEPTPKWGLPSRVGRLALLVTVIVGIFIALVITATRPAGAVDGSETTTDHAEPSSSKELGERVVVAEAGIALTVPKGWGFRVEMLETDWVEEAGVTEDVAVWRVLDMWSPDGDPELAVERCSIGMLRAGEHGPAITTISDTDPAPGELPPGRTRSTTEILLPAGSATRIDWDIVEPDGDHYSSTYNLAGLDGPTWLDCEGPERPDDDWLSIAETFEFLPAEE